MLVPASESCNSFKGSDRRNLEDSQSCKAPHHRIEIANLYPRRFHQRKGIEIVVARARAL
jgi:hypothetical protein